MSSWFVIFGEIILGTVVLSGIIAGTYRFVLQHAIKYLKNNITLTILLFNIGIGILVLISVGSWLFLKHTEYASEPHLTNYLLMMTGIIGFLSIGLSNQIMSNFPQQYRVMKIDGIHGGLHGIVGGALSGGLCGGIPGMFVGSTVGLLWGGVPEVLIQKRYSDLVGGIIGGFIGGLISRLMGGSFHWIFVGIIGGCASVIAYYVLPFIGNLISTWVIYSLTPIFVWFNRRS